MKAMMLGACLAATIGAQALAQPGDSGQGQPDPYYDQAPPMSQTPPQAPPRQPAPDEGYQSYGQYQPPWPAYRAARFTGRVGRAWRGPQGQICRWRQLTWQDAYGRQVYRWAPRCRDD